MTDRLDDLARSLAAEAEGGPVGRRSFVRRGLAVFGLGAAAVAVGAGPAAAARPGGGSTSCPPGLTACGGACRDLSNHNSHCGGCDKPCGSDSVCRNGTCVKVECTCPPVCTPKTCAHPTLAGRCGPVDDGCGGHVHCGCANGDICDSATGTCKDDPVTCTSSAECAPSTNPCREAACVDGICTTTPLAAGAVCGSAGEVCDGAGACVQCLAPHDCAGFDGECQHRTCTNGVCGTAFTPSGTRVAQQTAGDCQAVVCDGAGGTTVQPDASDVPPDDGNPCTSSVCQDGTPAHVPAPNGTACGTNQVCQNGTCTTVCQPTTCVQQGRNCGSIPDGCGGTLSCGTCSAPSSCGGGGTPGVCGCTPTTCAQQGKNCGMIADGCGRFISCGTCPSGQVCGASVPGVCG